jgi:hypothetical protein
VVFGPCLRPKGGGLQQGAFKAWLPIETDSGKATLNVKDMQMSHKEILTVMKAYNPWVAPGISATRGEFFPGCLSEDGALPHGRGSSCP